MLPPIFFLDVTNHNITMSSAFNNEQSGGDPKVSFEKIQSLLKAKDDTSRFVGLALLKAVLDEGRLAEDPIALRALWECISPKFLDRLLRAGRNEKFSQEEAKDMVDLAVAVLHIFTILLPEEVRKDSRLTKRTAPLVNTLLKRLIPASLVQYILLTSLAPPKPQISSSRRWYLSSASQKVLSNISESRTSLH